MEHEELFPLLCEVAEGKKSAFTVLYQKTSGHIYAIALRMLKDKGLAEEVTQDAFVKIWHNASSYQRSKGTVFTWMVSIIRYRALDVIRYRGIRGEESLVHEIDAPETEFSLLTSEHIKLEKCMEELEASQRQAIHLAYFNGLSHHEVERHLASPLGTIKSWIRRGLQSLQRCLSL